MEPLNNIISNLRVDYKQADLTETSVKPDPIHQFDDWFRNALDSKLPEPNAMTVASATKDGIPSARIALLKSFDESGFVFYTNYKSRKAKELDENPVAALVFFWVELERQVRVEGSVVKVSAMESAKYFLSRPYGSQIGAWVSHQSSIITARSLLEQKLNEMKQKFKEGHVPLPDFWGGYKVVPKSIEFWQGRPNRLHDRIIYTKKEDDTWQIGRLSP